MEAFRGGDEDMRRVLFLPVPFRGLGVPGADGNIPVQSQSGSGSLGGVMDLPGKGPQGSDPEEVGPPSFFRFRFFSCLQEGGNNQGVGFPAAGRGVDQSALAMEPRLPGLQLEGKRKPPLILKPGDGVRDAGMGGGIC